MGLFHPKTCEKLSRKTRAMYEVDNQEDDDVDTLLIYAPKKAKSSSLESLYSKEVDEETYKHRIPTIIKILIFGIVAFLIAFAVVFLIL